MPDSLTLDIVDRFGRQRPGSEGRPRLTRIIGGVAGGRAIRTPPVAETRPTADRVREALFSSLESVLGTLHGTSFLDLYAGSGAVGLEAASRGADLVTCVERDRGASALIRSNARSLGLDQVEAITTSVAALAAGGSRRAFEVVFLDPPYDVSNAAVEGALASLSANGWLADGAAVVVERSRRGGQLTWPAGFSAAQERRYGDTLLWYGRWHGPRGVGAASGRPGEES
jgi:16S rRNA (guanine966-N2)-methyltransferase